MKINTLKIYKIIYKQMIQSKKINLKNFYHKTLVNFNIIKTIIFLNTIITIYKNHNKNIEQKEMFINNNNNNFKINIQV